MHIIRLREPWQRAWQESSQVKTADSLRPARYHRRFNSPTGLTAQQTVWLVLQPIASAPHFAVDTLSIKLNGQSLPLSPASHDLSSHDSPSRVPHNLSTLHSPSRVLPPQTTPTTDSNTTSHRVSIAQHLQSFNILELTIPLAVPSDAPPALAQLVEVRLEIA